YDLSLLFDARGRLWVGTQGGGIGVLEDTRSGAPRHFRHIGAAEGLSNLNVDMLLADRQGRIWASTDDGIALIDSETFRVFMLHQADGATLPGYWAGSGAVTTEGELVFGGV
ncbi:MULTISPECIES: two-component regulator propeller domain-containing protein, partial [Streptomyces]